MEVNQDFIILRIMFSETSFGKSGNLTHDLIDLTRTMQLDSFVFEDSGGHSSRNLPSRPYLFGGTAEGIPVMVEIILKKDRWDELKEKVLSLLRSGKDNAAMYIIPVTGVIFNPNP